MSKVPSKRLKSAVNSKLSKTLSAGAFKHSRFSRANLTIFTIIFAAIGCYFLFFSHAATLVGDINSDGTVDATDFSFLVSSFGQSTSTCTGAAQFTCDLNGDSKVDFLDVSAIASNWGNNSQGLYTLPPDRTTAWNPGILSDGLLHLPLGSDGIPVRTTIYKTIQPSGDTTGATDINNIQSALNSCPSGQVVLLAAGNFYSNNTISIPSGRVLRGAGADSTVLKGVGVHFVPQGEWTTLINIGNGTGGATNITNLTSDATKDLYSTTLASIPSGLAPGEIVVIDQLSDPNITNWGYADGGVGSASRGWFARGPGTQAEDVGRPTGQILQIASISGNTVTFDTPFHMTYSVANKAQLYRFGTNFTGTSSVAPLTEWAGVEKIHLTGGTGGDGGANLKLAGAAFCWAKQIESDQTDGSSISFGSTGSPGNGVYRSVLRDSFIHDTLIPQPGGAGYGIVLNWHASDNLIENNIAMQFNKVMLMRSTGGGNVIGYNYMDNGWINYSQGWMEVGLNASHMAGAHYELFEGNQGFNFDADNTWGNATNIVAFRNQLLGHNRGTEVLKGGQEVPCCGSLGTLTDTSSRRAIGLMTGHWWYSFVGNVLGFPNMPLEGASSFKYQNIAGPWDSPVMWQLGYDPNTWIDAPDAKVISTTLRDGNFDYYTNKVHWHGIGGTSETQTSPPANATLPNSLYLTSKPSFFGNNTWPWVNGANGSNPVPGQLPARVRYDAGAPNTVP
jgi:hypothetical protein